MRDFYREMQRTDRESVTIYQVSGARLAQMTGGAVASRIESVSLTCEPRPVTATVFIDASYDGDVMVAAGDVEYTAGREANTTYNESLAGARVPGWIGVGGPRNIS
eukprot:SAG31_NODE_11286_length_1046_cov_1.178458_1_plen_105_part_10